MPQRNWLITGVSSGFGLDNKRMLNALKAAGNYGEIFERNVGAGSALKLPRGLNGLWSSGGLMYAIPYR
jgi:general L-amino acid transport system substrate-binding protein